MLHRLADLIRKQLNLLVDRYDERLRMMPGYATMPEPARRDLEGQILKVMADCLEAEDDTRLIDHIHQRSGQVLKMGFEPEWYLQAVTVAEEVVAPLIETLPEGTFVWKAISRSQNAVWRIVADEWKHAEESLRESEMRYQIIFDSTPVMFWLKDAHNRTLRINKAAANFEGVRPGDVEGKSAYDLYPHEQAEAFYQDDLEVIRSNRPKLGIVEQHTSVGTGKLMWVETGKTPVHDTHGEVVGVLAFGVDVTERLQAEVALQQTVEQQQAQARYLHAVLEAADELIQVSDLDLFFRRAVELARAKLGVERCGLFLVDDSGQFVVGTYGTDQHGHTTDERQARENIEQHAVILSAPRDRLWVAHDSPHTYYEGGTQHTVGAGWTVGTVLHGPAGPIGLFFNDNAISGKPLDEAQQDTLGVYCSLLGSMIASKRAEERSRLQSAALDSAANAMVITDRVGRILWVNPAFTALTGYSREEALAQNPRLLKSGRHDKAFYRNLWDTILAGGVWHGEVVNRRRDGALYTEDQTITPVRNERDEVTHFIAIKQDITERVRLEQEIHKSLEKRAYQVQISTEVAQYVAAAQELEELFHRVVTLVKERFSYYHAQLFRYDPVEDAVVLITGYGEIGRKMQAAGHKLAMGRGVVGTAAATGHSILAADVQQDADWRPNPHLPDTRGELAVPIKWRDQVLGVLDVQSDQANALTEDDRLLLEGMCGQIASAMQSTRLLESVQQSERDLIKFKLGLEQSTAAIFITDPQGVINYVNPAFERIYGFTREEAIGQTPRILKSGQIPPEQYRHFWQALLAGQTVAEEIVNKSKDGRLISIDGSNSSIKDEQGKIVGFLALHNDITERKQAAQQMEETLRETERLYAAVSHEGWQAYRQAGRTTEGYVFDRSLIRPAAEVWEPEIAQALEEQALITSRSGQRAVTVAPLAVRGETIGALGMYDDPAHPLSQEDLDLIEAVSEQVALAMESARLFDQTQMALADTRALFRFSDLASRETEIKSIYEQVAQLLVEETGFTGAWITLVDTQAQVLRGVAGAGPGMGPGRNFDVIPYQQMQTPATIAARERTMIVVNDPLRDERLSDLPEQMKAVVGKAIAMPVIVDGELDSIIAATRPVDEVDIGERDQRLLQTIAAQVAAAIQRVRLFEQTQRDAEREHTINRVTSRIRNARSVDDVLSIAAQELRLATRASRSVVEILPGAEQPGSPGNGQGVKA